MGWNKSIVSPPSASSDTAVQSGAQPTCTLASPYKNFFRDLTLLAAWSAALFDAATVVLILLMFLVVEDNVADSLSTRYFKFLVIFLASGTFFLSELLTNH